MDFEYRHSAEMEAFRREEVRPWLEENAPEIPQRPPDAKHMDAGMWRRIFEFRRALGHKGWLFPTYPAEYGGGGLTPEHAYVIAEELERIDIPLDSRFADTVSVDLPALLVWGTEEQKEQLLRPRLQGDLLAWQLFTEPDAGSDLASLQTRAVREGDDWIITGEKVFVGSDVGYAARGTKLPDAEQLQHTQIFCLAITEPTALRHHNLGYFVFPGTAPGVNPTTQDLLIGHGKRAVHLDDVRVGGGQMIGGETQGWQVAQTSLELEHGGGGTVGHRDRALEQLFEFIRKNGQGDDPKVRQAAASAYIDSQVSRLFGARNYWMYSNGQEMSYQGPQSSLWRKLSGLRIADAIREIAGPWALLDGDDPLAPGGGRLELHQRESLSGVHPGGTAEIQKVLIARRLGVSRTRESAAPTPSTEGAP